MKKFNHTFIVSAHIDDVARFHGRSASMAAITPPPVLVHIHEAPQLLENGDRMDFTMWMGPLPIRWIAEIEKISDNSFIDRQLEGPFASWEHRHTFEIVDNNLTAIHDEVTAEFSSHWFLGLLGRLMWLNMPVLFAYRAWKTKRILQSSQSRVKA